MINIIVRQHEKRLAICAAKHRCRRGFTFVEVVIAALIVAIMSAVAVPKYADSINVYRVQGAAARIERDLMLARRYAKATSSSKTVEFTESSNSYELVGIADPDRSSEAYEVELSRTGYPAKLVWIDLDVTDSVTFDQYGKPNVSGTVIVEAGDHERTVTIDGVTGKASVN